MKVIVNICRIAVALTFIFSGFVKAIDPLGTQYKIEDNKVKMTGEDALGYFVYDEAKGGLVIGTDDTSDQSKNMVKLLSGIVLKKK